MGFTATFTSWFESSIFAELDILYSLLGKIDFVSICFHDSFSAAEEINARSPAFNRRGFIMHENQAMIKINDASGATL